MDYEDRAKLFEDIAPLKERTLLPEHRRFLEDGSGISPDVIESRGYHSLESSQIYELIGLGAISPVALQATGWLAIPTFRPDGVKHGEVVRLFGSQTSGAKYLWPSGVSMAIDINPDLMSLVYAPEVPILITEGIKKADALLSQARREDFPCLVLSIAGYTGWRTRLNGTASVITPELGEIDWNGRRTYLIVDSDCRTNDEVWRGWMGFAAVISFKTGPHRTFFVPVPPKGREKQGADDYLLASGASLDSLMGHAMTPRFAEQDAVLTAAPLTSIGLDQLKRESGVRIPHLFASLVPEASIMLVAGHTGTFKTWAMLQMCIDGALGLPWQSHPKLRPDAGPFTSLYVNAEMSSNILGIRARLLLEHDRYKGIADLAQQTDERVKIVNEPALDLATTVGMERIEEHIIATGAKFVVLDSLSMTWHGDENSASEVGSFYARMREVSQRTGVAWGIIHHLLKPTSGSRRKGDPLTAAIRGSGQLVQQADVALVLTLKESSGTSEHERLVVMTHAKARTDIELPNWVMRFSNPDGLVAELGYLGQEDDLMHLFSTKATATTAGHSRYPQGDDRKRWALDFFRTKVPAMIPGSFGLSAKQLRTIISVQWKESFGDRKTPGHNTLDALFKELEADGYLEQLTPDDEIRQNGYVYAMTQAAWDLTDDVEQGQESEP